jgi:phospholipase/carboxylesterase
MALIDGPRLAAQTGRASHLVVFLHGYGADGHDLIAVAQQWQPLLPTAAFVAPHAPEICGAGGSGRQWFALTMRDPSERWRGAVAARPALDAFLDSELARLGLSHDRLVLVGFSQGTMMALHVGLRRATPITAIVGYSGLLVGPEHLAEAVAPAPILLVHGDEDAVIPVEALFGSAQALAEAGIGCEWHLSLGLGHGIDEAGLVHGVLFLQQRLGRNLKI